MQQVEGAGFLVEQFQICSDYEAELAERMRNLSLSLQSAPELQEGVLQQVSEETTLNFSLRGGRTLYLLIDKAIGQGAMAKAEVFMERLSQRAVESQFRILLSVMPGGLTASAKELVRKICHHVGRLIEGITYADALSHTQEAQENLVTLVRNATGLTSLNCRECESMPEADLVQLVDAAPQLAVLNMACCTQLRSNVVQRMIQRRVKMVSFDFAGCRSLDDTAFSNLGSCRFLRAIDLSKSQITDNTIRRLGDLGLLFLTVQKCKKLTDESLRHIAQFKTPLHTLDISGCEGLSKQPPLELVLQRHAGLVLVSSLESELLEQHARRFPFVTYLSAAPEQQHNRASIGYFLQFLQTAFVDAQCVVNEKSIHLVIPSPPKRKLPLVAAFKEYLVSKNVQLVMAYELLACPIFGEQALEFLGLFKSVTFFASESPAAIQPQENPAWKSIKALSLMKCPLRDLRLFASSELTSLTIEEAMNLTSFGAISEWFPKLRSLNLRKCKNVPYSALAKLSRLGLESFEFSLPAESHEDLQEITQDEIIALVAKLSQAKRRKARQLIQQLISRIAITPSSFGALYCKAMQFQIAHLSHKLLDELDTVFQGAFALSHQDDCLILVVTANLGKAKREDVGEFLKGLLETPRRLRLQIEFGKEPYSQESLSCLATIIKETLSKRESISFRNATSKVEPFSFEQVQKLIAQEKRVTFANFALSAKAISELVNSCPELEWFQCDTAISPDDVQTLLKGCGKLSALRLKKTNAPLLECVRKEAPELQQLELRGLPSFGTLAASFSDGLQELNLADSSLGDKELACFGSRSLLAANFEKTQITPVGLRAFLSRSPNLQEVHLSGTDIDDSVVTQLAESNKNLRKASFRGCAKLTEDALLKLYQECVHLQVVDVANCPNVNQSLAVLLLRNTSQIEKVEKFVIDLRVAYSENALRILMLHFYSARSLRIVANERTRTDTFEMLFRQRPVENLQKLAVEGFLGDSIDLMDLICTELSHLTHFAWKGPLNFGALSKLAESSNAKTLKLSCTEVRGIVDVDGVLAKLGSCSQLKHLTLLGFSGFSPAGLQQLLQARPLLKSVTLSQSAKMTADAIHALQSKTEAKLVLV